MNIYKLSKITSEQKQFILKRAETDISEHMKVALEVSNDVKENGDAAIIKYTEKFDKVTLKKENIKVTEEEFEVAKKRLDKEVYDAINYAYGNIKKFHEEQMPEKMWFTDIDRGIMAGEKTTPIASVCLYVPRGKGSFHQ